MNKELPNQTLRHAPNLPHVSPTFFKMLTGHSAWHMAHFPFYPMHVTYIISLHDSLLCFILIVCPRSHPCMVWLECRFGGQQQLCCPHHAKRHPQPHRPPSMTYIKYQCLCCQREFYRDSHAKHHKYVCFHNTDTGWELHLSQDSHATTTVVASLPLLSSTYRSITNGVI